ncbi:MAG: PEP-CTERM sorting domain-containing protein [Verrucomicrobia bacterium]|nr:PEP-CTERM sorting domain-containing protein [Verrucomicrobiota bacterium]
MKKIAVVLLACGIAANVVAVNAAGIGNRGANGSNNTHANLAPLVGSFFGGNTEGRWAYKNAGDLKDCLLGLDVLASGGSGGKSLDLSGLDCLPQYLVIKGGNGYVVLNYDQLSSIWGDNKIVEVAKTALRNGGRQVPDISHWAALGCKSVPEPSSVLASLGALAFGAFMLRRRHTA